MRVFRLVKYGAYRPLPYLIISIGGFWNRIHTLWARFFVKYRV